MYRQSKPHRKVVQYTHHGKYFKKLKDSHIEDEDHTFPLENMVIIDETDEDLSDNGAASAAACDDSESEAAVPISDKSGFKTLDSISRKHMTNYDIDHPASPASCDFSGSELASSYTATVKTNDEQPKKKARFETLAYNETAPISPSSDVVDCSSSNTAPEAENVDEESGKPIGTKHRKKNRHRKRKECQAIPHFKPVKSNKDVFKFLKNFELTNESDVTFAIKMAEMFSRALNKYREEKLEEMVCTEAEHETTEELCTSLHTTSHSSPSTRDLHEHSPEGLLVESENCLAAEAACSDDDV
ncbi:uncharacterized protein LOC134927811 isoform X2 [Pseudophryne corroboree]|uniref:uncharacterized protein LOC134927811 isoform X2 n=1 Tax=Pseudophryne corroboree TaxID=495146 RepID=UPI003081E5C1